LQHAALVRVDDEETRGQKDGDQQGERGTQRQHRRPFGDPVDDSGNLERRGDQEQEEHRQPRHCLILLLANHLGLP
jgi:hypothetical protein